MLGVGSTTPSATTTTTEEGEVATEQLPRTLLTIAVSQTEAEKMQLAVLTGELGFALLTEGSDVKPGPGITPDSLFR